MVHQSFEPSPVPCIVINQAGTNGRVVRETVARLLATVGLEHLLKDRAYNLAVRRNAPEIHPAFAYAGPSAQTAKQEEADVETASQEGTADGLPDCGVVAAVSSSGRTCQ